MRVKCKECDSWINYDFTEEQIKEAKEKRMNLTCMHCTSIEMDRLILRIQKDIREGRIDPIKLPPMLRYLRSASVENGAAKIDWSFENAKE